MNLKASITPGEFFDKLTILVNKFYHCNDPKDIMLSTITLIELCSCFPGMNLGEWNNISKQLKKLRDINKDLWSLEEIARTQNMKEPLKIWAKIREQNQARSIAKNHISDVLGSIAEVKDYRTGESQ